LKRDIARRCLEVLLRQGLGLLLLVMERRGQLGLAGGQWVLWEW